MVDFTKPFQFASCDVNRVKCFLKAAYPSSTPDMEHETIIKLLRFVEKDIVRVQDPAYHPKPQVVPSKGFKEDMSKELYNICNDMHEYILSTIEKK